MAFRWSKSLNAYEKWKFIFSKNLPLQLETQQSALTVSTYIRDVLWFANENNLLGKEWYKNVVISPIGETTILIQEKRSKGKRLETISAHPTHSIFDLIELAQSGSLKAGYTFLRIDDLEDITELLGQFNITMIDLGDNLCQVAGD